MSAAAPLAFSGGFDFGREASKDSNMLKTILSEPLEFQETAQTGVGLNPVEKGWLEVNPLPKNATSTNQTSSSAASLAAAASSKATPSSSLTNGKKAKTLFNGVVTQSFPSGSSNVGTGFNNTGNTCYLNSVLQALVHTPGLARLLEEHPDQKDCNQKRLPKSEGYCAACALRAVYRYSFLMKGQQSYVPSVFTNKLKQVAKHLRKGRQEDSHEFLRFLVDGIQNSELLQYHSDPTKIPAELKYTTAIHQLFGGRLRSRVTCQKCHHPSDTFDAFLDLSVEVKKCASVKAGFDKFIAKDRLDGSNKYKCEKCKSLQVATKQLTVHEPPKALVVHLKRFGPLGGKINSMISYDKTFDISPYMSQGQHGARYRLYALVLHSGSGPNSGHYTARVLSLDGTRWYSMDDSFVSSLGANAPLQLKDAYLLFYVREKGDALSQAVGSGGVKSKLKNPFVPPPPPPEEEEGQDESEAEEEEGKEESENAEAGPSRARATPTSTPAVANGTGKKRRHSDIAFAPEETEDSTSSAFARLTQTASSQPIRIHNNQPSHTTTPSILLSPSKRSRPSTADPSSLPSEDNDVPASSSSSARQHAMQTPQLSKTAKKKARKLERKAMLNPYQLGTPGAVVGGGGSGGGAGNGGGGNSENGRGAAKRNKLAKSLRGR